MENLCALFPHTKSAANFGAQFLGLPNCPYLGVVDQKFYLQQLLILKNYNVSVEASM